MTERTTTGNSTYKKLAVQWLNDPDSYRDCASYHPDSYREWWQTVLCFPTCLQAGKSPPSPSRPPVLLPLLGTLLT